MAVLGLPLLVKALSTALIVVLASVLAEAAGPFWGALVASLPVSAGPAYFFLAMQHDGDFVAASALSSFAANAATGLFLVVYGVAARRLPGWCGLGAAMLAWLLASMAVRPIGSSVGVAVLLNLAVYGVGFLILGRAATGPVHGGSAVVRRWFDLPLRAGVIAVFVSAVVVASSMLGPAATGIAAVFPISLTSLVVLVQPRIGRMAAAALAGTALRAMLGFGVALLVLHLSVGPLGVWGALAAALLVSILWSVGLMVVRFLASAGERVSPV